MFCNIMVLPALGGETMRPRWPLPMGATRSMVRAVMSSVLPLPISSPSRFWAKSGVKFSNRIFDLGVLGPVEVDVVDLEQRKVALAVLGRADLAGDGVAGAQGEAADLAGGDIDVVRAGQVGGVRGAQKAEAVRQDLQHAVAGDVLAAFGLGLEDGEDQVLFAGAADAFDLHGLRQLDQFGHRRLFQFG